MELKLNASFDSSFFLFNDIIAPIKQGSTDILLKSISALNQSPLKDPRTIVPAFLQEIYADPNLAKIPTTNTLKIFNPNLWAAISRAEYIKSQIYATKAKGKSEIFNVLNYVLNQFNTTDTYVNIFIIGDFNEIKLIVSTITDPSTRFGIGAFSVDWAALTNDPYDGGIKGSFPIYDKYQGEKWYLKDNETPQIDATWLNAIVKKSAVPYKCIITESSKNNYIQIHQNQIKKWFIDVYLTIKACAVGSSAIVKLNLPTHWGIYGPIGFFSLHFETVNIIKTYASSWDDDTCYLVGSKFIERNIDIDLTNDALIWNVINEILIQTSPINASWFTFNEDKAKWIAEIKEKFLLKYIK